MSGVDLFPGFGSHWIDTEGGRIFARTGGSGPPLALLHGFPESSLMWAKVAPQLATRFSLVVMDLRGYGWSSAPRSEGGEGYSKRAMAGDLVTVMESLGHVRFSLAGHDRGGRVGYRLALDHPGRIEKLALLDILPTSEVWRAIEAGDIPAAHWGFLSGAAPGPEQEIGKIGPDAYFGGLMREWAKDGQLRGMDPRALSEYRNAWRDSSRIHAFCEDYRASAGPDRRADEADLAAARTIACPTLILTGDFFLTRGKRPAIEVWRSTFAPDAQGEQIESGHFLAEENPADTAAAMLRFF
ncbi:MAG: alpha/beta hydrolase [Beijerinckiaceae bacterium]|nr:alpha/beta hydrolase [Beijerinckiaceae bacterium]